MFSNSSMEDPDLYHFYSLKNGDILFMAFQILKIKRAFTEKARVNNPFQGMH